MSLFDWLGSTTPDVSRLPALPTEATMAGRFDPAGDGSRGASQQLWNQIAGSLGKLGQQGEQDSNYLKIGNPGQSFNPGNSGLSSLLATLIQMHQNAAASGQSGGPRTSLLG